MTFRPTKLLTVLLAATVFAVAGCASTQVTQAPTNIVTAADANADLTTFAKLARQAGLADALEASGPITVFVPTNDAFKAVPAATLDKMAKDPQYLKSVLSYHVVPGLMKSSDVDGSKLVTTSSGAKMTVSKAGDFVTVDEGLVTKADVITGNGVIHVVDSVLLPPKK